MKKLVLLTAAVLCGLSAQAQSLYFTSGVVSNYTNVTLNIQGPTNLVCQVERLNYDSQQWDWQGFVTLNTNGIASFNTSLYGGFYGFFRVQSTNGYYLSTNAFGAVSDYLANGYSFIGNPFEATSVTNIMPTAPSGTTVYWYNNATTNYNTSKYLLGSWRTPITVNQLDGFLVNNPSTNAFRFIVSGLFTTNTITKSIPSGYSMQMSPLYKIMNTSTAQIDLLTTNRLGGFSCLPVRSYGFTNECELKFLTNSVTPEYQAYNLANANWYTSGWPTSVPLHLVEGFWVNKPTNATWNVQLSIW